MVREGFEDSFERLREQSNKLADVPRDPEHLDEIVAERVELDQLRHEARAERKKIVSHYEYPAPDVVEPPRGYLHTGWVGKVGAAISVALLVVIAGLVVFGVVGPLAQGFPLRVTEVVETLEPDCSWRVEATIHNDSDHPLELIRFETVLERQIAWAAPIEMPTLSPGESATAIGSWPAAVLDQCDSPDSIDHGNLIVRYTLLDGEISREATVSRSF